MTSGARAPTTPTAGAARPPRSKLVLGSATLSTFALLAGGGGTTLVRDGVRYVAVGFVDVPTAGEFAVSIDSRDPTQAVLVPSYGTYLVRFAGPVLLLAAGGFLLVVGLVLLAVALVRSQRRRKHLVTSWAGPPDRVDP